MQLFILALTVTGMMSTVLIAPAVPELLGDLRQPPIMAGVVIGAGTLPAIVTAPIIGVMADRYGRRAVLIPCLATFAVFGIGASYAPSFGALIVLRLLQGVGGGSLINLALVLIGDHWSGAQRIKVLGRNTAMLLASVALLAPLGGALTSLGGWRLAFAPYGVGMLLLAPTMSLLGSRPNRARIPQTFSSQLLNSFRRAGSREIRTPLLIGFILLTGIYSFLFTILPLHLESVFNMGAGLIGSTIAASGFAAMIVALKASALHRRWSAGSILLSGGVLFGLGYVTLGLAGALVLVVFGVLVNGTAEGLLVPTLQGLLAEAAGAEERGAVMALWASTVRLGQTLGPLAGGVSTELFGTEASLWVGGLLAGSAMVLLVRNLRVPAKEQVEYDI